MNIITYNEKDLQTLYNKYRMSGYNPNDTVVNPNISQKMSSSQNISGSQPQYTAIGSHNLLLNSSRYSRLPNKNPNLNNTSPVILKPNQMERNRLELLQDSDKVFDEIEFYGLVLTNDLLKLRRLQQMITKNDFTLAFEEFRKRLYTNIDNTGDKMVSNVKRMKDEFTSVREQIEYYFKRQLGKADKTNSKLNDYYNELNETIYSGMDKMRDLYRKRAERINTLRHFLYPPPVTSGIEVPKELMIDWDARMERLRSLYAYRKLNKDFDDKLGHEKEKMNLLDRVNLKEERVRQIKLRDLEKKKKANQANFLKDEEERNLQMIKDLEEYEKQLEEEEERKRIEEELREKEKEKENGGGEKKYYTGKSSVKGKSTRRSQKSFGGDEGNKEKEGSEKLSSSGYVSKNRDSKYDFTDVPYKKYQKSELKSDVSPVPPTSLLKEKEDM